MKGSRDRTADREAYRNSPVWENMRREIPLTADDWHQAVEEAKAKKNAALRRPPTISPDLPPGVNPEDVPV